MRVCVCAHEQEECNPETCTQMTATEQWIFLCAAHKTPKEVGHHPTLSTYHIPREVKFPVILQICVDISFQISLSLKSLQFHFHEKKRRRNEENK